MVTAFIPVRGGSKSIPLKNIKEFCGKPLVYWTVAAAHGATCVDKVIVATDSEEIESAVKGFGFDKVSIFRRSAYTATDTASTESAMLEYLRASNLCADDIFILVQATSPLTESKDIEKGMELYRSGEFDSVLSCVRNKRFFWSTDGRPLNYDYTKRPRRQEFEGMLMENGAFYISSVRHILSSENRLSGRIGVSEMPEYTSFEIDEPDDWTVMESLMYRHILNNKQSRQVRLFVSDVDGVMTDGGMYYSENGDELKKFNTRDGMGFQLIREAGIKTAIVTSEMTELVSRRAKKLKIDFLCQARKNGGKLDAVKEICESLGIGLQEVAYIGDDVNCLEILKAVGVKACPSDALPRIKAIGGINVMKLRGGEGCVREFAEMILSER
jgi:3-deoxy-D-manno-octulosonate 8-phosphate phosphatase, YrbI family